MKKRTYFKFVILIYSFFPLFCFSQNNPFKIPEVTPMSPNVAGLIKYAEIPINYYNGTTQYSLPLYELKEGDLNLPISLSYFSNGLKVEEEASWVGLGWSLNAGGIIQMIPRGENHLNVEITPLHTNIEAVPNPNTDYFYSDNATNMIENGCQFHDGQGNFVYMSMSGEGQGIYGGFNPMNMGNDYDMYMYNFAGYSGKFIDDRHGNLVLLDRSNIKFEQLQNGNIIATTTDGNKYYFDIKATTANQSNAAVNYSYTYYLTRILSPMNNEINFSYVPNRVQSVPHFTQTRRKGMGYSNSFVTASYFIKKNDVNEYVLSEINTVNAKISFSGSLREDLYVNIGSSYRSTKLDVVKIYRQGENNPIETINFDYDYFLGMDTYGDFTTFSNPAQYWGEGNFNDGTAATVSLDCKRKRLRLNGVRFFGNEIKYNFEYDHTPLPYKTSFAQDLWGYFNGVFNYQFLPDVNNLGYYDIGVPSYFLNNSSGLANRKSSETFMKAGILTKIFNPTGGHTKIEYEINNFAAPSGVYQDVTLVEKYATDIGSNQPQVTEFTIPNLVANQTQKLSINLVCNPTHRPCEQDNTPYQCAPYQYQGMVNDVHPNDNRIYGLLEKKVNNQWVLVDVYSNNTTEVVAQSNQTGSCGLQELVLTLPPGEYRMTANFPDNRTGYSGGPWSQMKISYYEHGQILPQPNIGAGLRVKRISEYNAISEVEKVTTKSFIYNNGNLMTKPIFYRKLDFMELISLNNTSISCINFEVISSAYNGVENASYNDYALLESEPVLPYSYNANGSLVGYGEVSVLYGENIVGQPSKFIGMETYKYKNEVDKYMQFKSELPGITGGKIMGNGSLLEKVTKKVLNPGVLASQYFDVKREQFDYELKELKVFWPYHCEYVFPGAGIGVFPHTRYNFVHFYPIKAGIFRLKKKTVNEYFENQSTITTNVEYSYNFKHQLINEKVTNSKNELVESKKYYPNDLTLGSQSTSMLELINQNRINIPIKTETIVDGQKTGEQVIKFVNDGTTGNKLLPKEIYNSKGSSSINLNIPDDRKIVFDNYDEKGNVTQYTVENGIPVSLIWGYHQTQPVAKLENVLYSSIPSNIIGNIQTKSNADIDNANTCSGSTCTEEMLRAELNSLRANPLFATVQITTYTYDPLIGVTSITDPKSDIKYFNYDGLGRLQNVKDNNGNILSENEYHYKP